AASNRRAIPARSRAPRQFNAFAQQSFNLRFIRARALVSNPLASHVARQLMQAQSDAETFFAGHLPILFDLQLEPLFGSHSQSTSLIGLRFQLRFCRVYSRSCGEGSQTQSPPCWS